ncbi:hypothetical protein B0J15DRAFT_559742 [Fusarium solani]|uniref:Uncharacterized protein n=1 Tax=Fusarium solani TaxID=169388 RepID=A0A9P9HA85_FUSSL|nr:uncharacterized protein B0J15DRAFT_559742 [Fusarium solani]KAH7252909.1 hypothetical protein B0J15DRAFT_559742 [Fusarium solani]
MPLCKSEDFESWHHSLNLQNAAQQVHHANIHSTPDDLALRRDYRVWQRWEEKDGQYPAFETAINRITELPHLEALELRFSDRCQGIANKHPFSDHVEEAESRINTLKAVFGALNKRAANPKNSAVRSLTIENLQNLLIPNFTKSIAFRNVMKDVKELHLSIATEYNEHGPDRDVYKDKRQTFEPFLQTELLASIAQNLTALTLKFDQEWGTVPGQFDGRNLLFPKLESLTLENFVIGHHDHIDWVYAQRTLKSLHLKDVRIASHLLVEEESIEKCGLRTEDWKSWPRAVFDSIRTSLSNLVDFRLYDQTYGVIDNNSKAFNKGVSPQRYISFSEWILPSPWIEAESDGELPEFSEGWPEEELDDEKEEQMAAEDATLNPASSNEEGDKRALDELLEAVKQRQG